MRIFLMVLCVQVLGWQSAWADGSPLRFQATVTHSKSSWKNFWETLLGRPHFLGDLAVKVTDESGKPMAGAMVLVGSKKGDPFETNYQPTDANGVAQFRHEFFRSGEPYAITITREGFASLTLASTTGNEVNVQLQAIPGEEDFAFFRGRVTGFPSGYDSNTLELGLFLPAFRPDSFLNFDPQDFISSYKVKMDVYGERDIPGNLVFPSQTKWYGIVPISINKPEFIMPLEKGLTAHMMAMVGGIGISEVYDATKEKDFLKAMNLANFTHVNWTTRPVEVRGNERFDINANQAIQPKILDSRISGIEGKLDVISVSVFDPAGDRGDFVPLDVKAIKSEEVKNGQGRVRLGLLKQRKPQDNFYVFTGLFDRKVMEDKKSPSRWIVGALSPVNQNGREPVSSSQKFLRPIRSLGVSRENRNFLFSPAGNEQKGIMPDFVIVNLISEKRNELTKGKNRTLLWSAILPGNAQQLSLPDLGKPVLPSPNNAKEEKFWWEAIAIKSGSAQSADLDIQSALRNLEHVSTLQQKF